MRSDYFRLCFLSRVGGLYVDADDVLHRPDAIGPLVETGFLQLQPLCYQLSTDSMVVPDQFTGEVSGDFTFYVANDPIITPPNHPVVERALEQATARLITAGGLSRDIQRLTGPINLSEALARHSLHLLEVGHPADFQFISSWVKIAPGDWTLEYRNDDRNWRRWVETEIAL
jgi:mannosyltransferase OCH1-like enzyme